MYLRFYINENGDKVYTTKKESPVGRATESAHPEACYAFGIVDAMYASQYLSDGHALKGSEQDFLDFLHHTDFSFSDDDHVNIDKCGVGNSLENATDYVKYHGLLLDEDYEYKSKCQDNGDPDWFYKRPKTRKLYANFVHIEDDHTYLVGDGKFGGFLRVQPVLASIRLTPSFESYSNAHVFVASFRPTVATYHSHTMFGQSSPTIVFLSSSNPLFLTPSSQCTPNLSSIAMFGCIQHYPFGFFSLLISHIYSDRVK